MSDSANDTTIDVNTDDLDQFTELFEGRAKPAAAVEEVSEVEDEDALPAVDEAVEEEAEEEESDEGIEPEDTKPKSRFQERITELTNKQRDTERKLEEAMRLLEAKADAEPKTEKTEDKPSALVMPDYEATNEDGTDKYPLGQFDPKFILDVTNYGVALANEQAATRAAEEAQRKEFEAEDKALNDKWQADLSTAGERYPDYVEKTALLEDTFRGLDPAYGDYLGKTLMSMEAGVDVLYYLSENVDEAKAIVASGPVKATIALGRLEAKFSGESKEEKAVRVTKVPAPPTNLVKGRAASRTTADDTDDLDAFSEKFFAKKR